MRRLAWHVCTVCMILAVILLVVAGAVSARADPLSLAYYDSGLGRKGPGLLLRDALRNDPQVAAVRQVIDLLDADVLVLADVDYDADLLAGKALNDGLTRPYPHLLALRPNSGMATGLDLDGNGRLGEARDAQGYGRFSGAGGLLLLSRFPIGAGVRDFSGLLWKDLPGSLIAPDDPGHDIQRLSSTGHWLIPLEIGSEGDPVTDREMVPETERGRLWIGAFKATPPIFDGPEDRNGRRNHDEVAFWSLLLAGHLDALQPGLVPEVLAPEAPSADVLSPDLLRSGDLSPDDPPFRDPVAILGGANLDPRRGAGRRDAIRSLLADPRLVDPMGDRDQPTALWTDPGPMRVDYVLLPSGAEGIWAGVLTGADDPGPEPRPEPGPDTGLARALALAGPHRPVFATMEWPLRKGSAERPPETAIAQR